MEDAGRKPKVGMCTSSSKLDDSSFLFSAWNGLKKAKQQLRIDTLVIEAENAKQIGEAFDYFAEQGFGLIWAVGYTMEEQLERALTRYPWISFASVDVSYPKPHANLTTVTFREQEAAYLAGYVAARTTASGRIGFIGGADVPVIHRFQRGFTAGAARANPDAAVEVAFADSFLSYAKGRRLAAELAERGCDVLFHAAGSVGKGMIRQARELGIYAIGCDIDQSFLAPEIVLTSVTKSVERAVLEVSGQFAAGELAGARVVELGLDERYVDLAPVLSPPVPADASEELERLRQEITTTGLTG